MTGNDWQTPDWFLALVRRLDQIALDPCTTHDNPTKAVYIRTAECAPHGLQTDWHDLVQQAGGGLVFVNPPYGRGLMEAWTAQILAEATLGTQILALVRGDTSTSWCHRLLRSCDAVGFPNRIRFKGATGSPNFSNLIFYFGKKASRFEAIFSELGPVLVPTSDGPCW